MDTGPAPGPVTDFLSASCGRASGARSPGASTRWSSSASRRPAASSGAASCRTTRRSGRRRSRRSTRSATGELPQALDPPARGRHHRRLRLPAIGARPAGAMMTIRGSRAWPAGSSQEGRTCPRRATSSTTSTTMLALRRVPLFEGLDPEDLQRIAATADGASSTRRARRSCARATSGDELFVIVEGSVRVVHHDPRRHRAPDPDATSRATTSASWRSCASAPRRDGHRRGRRRPRPGHRRRRASRRSCANDRTPRWRCSRPSPSGSAPRHDRPWPTADRAVRPADRDGHLPAHRRRGLDGARARARAPPGTSSIQRHLELIGRGGRRPRRHDRPDRGRRPLRRLPGGRSPPSRPPSRRSGRSRPRPGRPGSRSASGSGLHTGEAHRSGDDYGGFDVNRAARVAAVGHGGQVVLSETTAALVADALPAGDDACATSAATCSRTCRAPSA